GRGIVPRRSTASRATVFSSPWTDANDGTGASRRAVAGTSRPEWTSVASADAGPRRDARGAAHLLPRGGAPPDRFALGERPRDLPSNGHRPVPRRTLPLRARHALPRAGRSPCGRCGRDHAATHRLVGLHPRPPPPG